MSEPLILLDSNKINNLLNPKIKPLIDLIVLESTPSTNDYFKKSANKDRIRVCLAEQQTQGKGRFGRQWHSPFAQNIYFSCSYPFRKDINALAGLSLVTGLAIIKTLADHDIKEKVKIKWPNDVLCDEKKLAGTLIEVNTEGQGVCDAIIGIGINANMLQVDENDISQAWISMQQISGKNVDRNNVVAALINNLLDYIQRFEVHGLAHFMNDWQAHDRLLGRDIVLISGKEEIAGKAAGINEQGHLLLNLADGKTQAFSSGDASVKKPA